MEQLAFEVGGRPLYNDDFELLQSEVYYAIFSQYLDLPTCAVHGLAVRDLGAGFYDIDAGLVFIEAGLYRFDGVSSVGLPLELRLDAAVETTRPYQSGGSKRVTSERKLVAQPISGAPGDRLLVTANGVLRADKAREATYREPGEMGLFTIFPAQYDTDGKGLYGTRAYGWQLLNGKNSQPNAAGKSLVVAGTGAGNEYQQLLAGGGSKLSKIEIVHLPPHAHDIDQAGDHTHGIWSRGSEGGDNRTASRGNDAVNDGSLHTQSAGNHVHTMQNTGGGQELDTRDPWLNIGARVWVGL